jgi:rare lipoprotein A
VKRILIASLPAWAILGVAFFLLTTPVLAACGTASWYGEEHDGRRTASGEIFRQWALTAAMPRKSQFGTYRVTSGGKSVTVRVNDTGSFAKYGRGMDLSRGAFSKLAHTDRGVIRACWERVER